MLKIEWGLGKFILTGLLVLAFLPSAEAALRKCVDANNRTYYQDKPCQDLIAARLPGSLARLGGKEEDRAFMWKAVGEKGTLYLMGTLYYGRQDMSPFPQMIMDAFGAANVLVLETDIRNLGDKERSALLRERGRYEDKDTLEAHVKSTTWAKALAMAKKLGISEEGLSRYKPWLAAITLSAESFKQAGFTPDLGVGQSFLKLSEAKKPVLEMESLEEQVKLLEELTPLEQEQLLLQTLQDLGRAPDYYNNLADAWRKGDVETMDQITRQSYDVGETSTHLFKLFFEDRNDRMANSLKDFAAQDKTYFVIMGAGHFGGEKGVLKLLQNKGFKVTQP